MTSKMLQALTSACEKYSSQIFAAKYVYHANNELLTDFRDNTVS